MLSIIFAKNLTSQPIHYPPSSGLVIEVQGVEKDNLRVRDSVLQRCVPFQLRSGFTAAELLTNIIPRPTNPEAGIPLGTEEDSSLVTASGLPPSRRGKTMKRKARHPDVVDDTASRDECQDSGANSERQERSLSWNTVYPQLS
jgi:hypothetical protein